MRNHEQGATNHEKAKLINLQDIGKQALNNVGSGENRRRYYNHIGQINPRDFPSEPTPEDLEVMRKFHLSYEELGDMRGLRGYCFYTNEEPSKSRFKNRRIYKVWEADVGWEDSIQYAKALCVKTMVDEHEAATWWYDLHDANPYVYPNLGSVSPEEQQLNENIESEMVELYDDIYHSLDPETVGRIERLREQGDFLEADKLQVEHIKDILGIEIPIEISYDIEEGQAVGYFRPEVQAEDGSTVNKIVIKRFSNDKTGIYDERDREIESEIGNTIMHELFHAWQYQQKLKGGPRGELYAINDDNYHSVYDNPDGLYWEDQWTRYHNQLNEREAHTAGKAYSDFARKIREFMHTE